MRKMKLKCKTNKLSDLLKIAALATLLFACFVFDSAAQQKGQKMFSSSEEASKAFVDAVQSNDETAIREILGPDSRQIVSSGDPTEDAESRANFALKYQEMHRFVKESDGSVTLYIGAENWPTPIPLAMKGNFWFFRYRSGKERDLVPPNRPQRAFGHPRLPGACGCANGILRHGAQ
jgi:Protein of unknown function (DUF2950)